MAIEAISGAGMTYQGSTSTAQIKTEIQPRVESASNEAASNQIAAETVSIDTKTMNDGNSNNAANQNAAQNAKIKQAVEELNKKSASTGRQSEAIFGIHEATNRVTIKIVDKDTREIIKEYPPEKTLDMIAKVWEMAGLMVDERR